MSPVGIILIIIAGLVTGYLGSLLSKKGNRTSAPQPPKSQRRHVRDVKPGEWILVEYSGSDPYISNCKCISNDPDTRKILVEFQWSNWKDIKGAKPTSRHIFEYGGYELANFHLLNKNIKISESTPDDHNDVATLQKKINEAIEKEEYEVAEKFQKQLDKLSKK